MGRGDRANSRYCLRRGVLVETSSLWHRLPALWSHKDVSRCSMHTLYVSGVPLMNCDCHPNNQWGARHVPGVGPTGRPRLAIIGEAPGEDEDKEGVPFVGGAGRILGRWLYEAGVFRSDCYIDNVFSHRPPLNDLAGSNASHAAAAESLLRRLDTIRPSVVVAAGDTALHCFGRTGISLWRGSAFRFHRSGWSCWVVPTLHPAFIMRQQALWRFCVGDVRFAFHEAHRRVEPTFKYSINPSPTQLEQALKEIPDGWEVSIDLETTRDFGLITQVVLSWEDHQAVCFDMEEEYLLPLLRVLKRPLRWVGQNAVMFDSVRLAELGAPLIRIVADIMLVHHLLESPAPHDLGFINGQYLHDPYWKDEITSNRHEYACKDADATRRIWRKMEPLVQREGMGPLFDVVMAAAHYMRKVHLRGVPVDPALVREEAKVLHAEADKVLSAIRTATGSRWFNPRSWKDCQEFLYEKLKLPVQYN